MSVTQCLAPPARSPQKPIVLKDDIFKQVALRKKLEKEQALSPARVELEKEQEKVPIDERIQKLKEEKLMQQ